MLYIDSLAPEGGSVDLVLEAPEGADGTASCLPLCPDTFQLTATSAPLASAVVASEASVEAVAWFKSWNNAPSPGAEVAFSLLVGSTEVAKGSKTADVMNNAIVEFRVAMPYTGPAVIPAGSVITWKVDMVNGACDCYPGTGYARGVSADHPWSVALPGSLGGAGGPAAATYEVLSDLTVNVTRAFANETTATQVFNWTGPATPLALSAAANGTGNATLTVVDAANRTLFAGNLSATPSAATFNGTAGNWSLTLDLAAFKGNVTLVLAPPAAVASGSASGTGTGSSGNATDGNETLDLAEDGKSKAEAPAPFALPLLAIGTAIALARRRR